MWPVAIAEAFGVVSVGYMAWLLANQTPVSRSLASAGERVASIDPGRRPSATKMMALRARAPGAAAAKGDAPSRIAVSAAPARVARAMSAAQVSTRRRGARRSGGLRSAGEGQVQLDAGSDAAEAEGAARELGGGHGRRHRTDEL